MRIQVFCLHLEALQLGKVNEQDVEDLGFVSGVCLGRFRQLDYIKPLPAHRCVVCNDRFHSIGFRVARKIVEVEVKMAEHEAVRT